MRSHSTAPIERKLGDAGVLVLFLRNETLDQAMAAIQNIGQVTGQVEEASALQRKIGREMEELEAKVQGAPRPRVAVAVNHDPLILAGRGSFLHELMELAGGANIASDSKTPHPQFSAESLIARAPEVIIDVSEAFSRGASDRMVILKWDKLPSTPARKNRKIYPLERGIPIDPGPRVALLLRFMARKFHPDRF